jgi:hypothetical protein
VYKQLELNWLVFSVNFKDLALRIEILGVKCSIEQKKVPFNPKELGQTFLRKKTNLKVNNIKNRG